MPSFDLVIGGYTLVPNPFWGGAAFPLVVFGFLYLWPWLERRFTRDYAFHNLLDRPRDAPVRTGIGVAMVTWVTLVFLAGGADRAYVSVRAFVRDADRRLPRDRVRAAGRVRRRRVADLQVARGERARPRATARGGGRGAPRAEVTDRAASVTQGLSQRPRSSISCAM